MRWCPATACWPRGATPSTNSTNGGSAFNLAAHPQIIGRPSRFSVLERLIKYMLAKPNVRFARMDEAADEWAAANANAPAQLVGVGPPAED